MNKAYQFLQQQVDNNATPAVCYCLVSKDGIIQEFMTGIIDIERGIPVASNHSFHLFSITKTFTAIGIMQLAEKGSLNLDDAVADYLTRFAYSPAITIRQLLNHSSGIPSPVPLGWIHHIDQHGHFDSDAFFEPIFKQHSRLKFTPGHKFSYSNLGYVLLGQLIERVSGESYPSYIQHHIIDALGISSNQLGFLYDDQTQVAKGYIKNFSLLNWSLGLFIDKKAFTGKPEGKWRPFNRYYINGSAYGGLIGTPLALASYAQDLLQTESKLVSQYSKHLMFTENFGMNGKPSGMCLSWFKGSLGGNTYYCHAGGGGGYYSEIRIYPKAGLASLVIFNRTGVSDERFLDKVDRFYFENNGLIS